MRHRSFRLYADFAPHKLLAFLKRSDEYPMAEALDECTMRGMTPERIYLLARMGSTRAALELIMRELVDVEQAVQFCKEQDDPELWEDLIRCSLDKPPFIIVLLNNVGTHIDPRQLVERIEPGLEIPGLRQSLIQILRDYNLQVSLQEGCKRILVSDCYSLLTRKVRGASRGLLVSSEASCPECGEAIVRDPVGVEVSFPSICDFTFCFNPLHLVLDLWLPNSTFHPIPGPGSARLPPHLPRLLSGTIYCVYSLQQGRRCWVSFWSHFNILL